MPKPMQINQRSNPIQKQTVTLQQPGPQTTKPKTNQVQTWQKSAYQENLQQPIQLPTQQETTRSLLGKIKQKSQSDPQGAYTALNIFQQWQQDKTSPFYNPYTQATNQAIGNLKALGVNTDRIDDDWFAANGWLKDYYKTSGTTNTPSAPGKKATLEENAAYQYYQVWQAEENTRKAETEWAALQNELAYWANRKDRNLSDEEILEKINWDNYKTLQKMDATREMGAPMELNRAVGYSRDAMYGALWAARNGGGTGDSYLDMANSYNGVGNVWKEDPEITAKLDKGNKETYSPYSVGSTMDAECSYFGVDHFDEKWIRDNREKYLGSGDATAAKYYGNVVEAYEYTQKLLTQKQDLDKRITNLLKYYDDPNTGADTVLKLLKDDDDYKDLFALDKTLDTGKLKETTEKVDYRWQDVEAYVRDQFEQKKSRPGVKDVVSEANATTPNTVQPVPEPTNGEVDAITGADMKVAPGPTATPKPPVGEAPAATAAPGTSEPKPTATQKPTVTPAPTATPAPMLTDTELELEQQGRENLETLASTILEDGTDAEKIVLETGKTGMFDWAADQIRNSPRDGLEWLQTSSTKDILNSYMDVSELVYNYEEHQAEADRITEQLDDINGEWEELQNRADRAEAIGGMSQEEYDMLQWLKSPAADKSDDEWALIREQLAENPDNQDALQGLYWRVTGDPMTSDTGTVRAGKLEQAKLWWESVQESATNISPIDRMIQENQDQGFDGASEEITANGVTFEIYLDRDEDGNMQFTQAWNKETNEVYGSDWKDDINEMLGWSRPTDFLTEEEQERLEDLTSQKQVLEERLDAERGLLEPEQEAYRRAKMQQNQMVQAYAASLAANQMSGKDSGVNVMALLDYALAAGRTEVVNRYPTNNVLDLQVQEGLIDRATATKQAASNVVYNAQLATLLDQTLAELDSYGAAITPEMRANIEANAQALRDDARASGYVALDGAEGFEAAASVGREKAAVGKYGRIAKAIALGNYGFEIGDLLNAFGATNADRFIRNREIIDETISVMTDEEKNRYFYLLEKDGEKAANDYLGMLTDPEKGILVTRRSQEIQQQMHDFASQNALTGAVATGLSFVTNFMGGPSAVLYETKQKLLGKQINPYAPEFDWQLATSSMRSGVKEQISSIAGEGSVADVVGNIIYDGFTSSVDSWINAQTTDALFNAVGSFFSGTRVAQFFEDISDAEALTERGIPVKELLGDTAGVSGNVGSWLGGKSFSAKVGNYIIKVGGDLAHASTMGMNAAAAAYRDVIINNGSEDQAVRMALATFFAETGSEAVTVGNFHDAFAAGSSEEAGNLLIQFFKNGAEEFLGEGANEWMEQWADRIIMGEMSEYEQIVKKYQALNLPDSVCRELADKEMWKNILTAAATGFVSSGFGTATEYARGKLTGATTQTDVNAEQVAPAETVVKQDIQEQAPEITQPDVIEESTYDPSMFDPNPDWDPGNIDWQAYEDRQATLEEDLLTARAAVAQETSAEEEAPVTEEPVNAAPNGIPVKELSAITSMKGADPTGAAVTLAAVLGDGSIAKAAAQKIVSSFAGGDTNVVSAFMTQYLTNIAQDRAVSHKVALIEAALVGGESAQTLQGMVERVARGDLLSSQDTTALLDMVTAEHTADPRGKATGILNAVQEFEIANRTAEILQRGEDAEAVRSANAEVEQAQENLQTAEEIREQAEADVATATETLEVAVEEHQRDAENTAAVAPVEQAAEQVEAAIRNREAQDRAVEQAQENVERAKQNRARTGRKALNNARSQAQQEIAQQHQQEDQAAYEAGVARFAPTVPFGRSFTAVTKSNRTPVKLTGVYDIANDGNTIVYTTEQGLLVTSDFVDVSDQGNRATLLPRDLLQLEDQFVENPNLRPANRPVVYLPVGITATVNGEQVQLIGIAGKMEAPDGYTDPVLMDSNGGLHVAPRISLEAVDVVNDLFDQNVDSLQKIPAKAITTEQPSQVQALKSGNGKKPKTTRPKRIATYKDNSVQALRTWANQQQQTPTQQQAKKVTEALKSPQQIANNLLNKLGFGNYIGSNRFGSQRGARAFYDRHGKYVAVKAKDAGNNNVTGHEIGHAIADRLGIRGTQDMVNRLMLENPAFWSQYEPDVLKNEAMAEFMWRYLEDEQSARDFAGNTFYNDFESRMRRDRSMWEAVQEAKAQMTAFYGAETDAQIQSIVRYERGGQRQSIREVVRSALAQIVDRSAAAEPIEHFVRQMTGQTDVDLDQSVRKTALLANHSQKRVTQILVDNLIDPTGKIVGDGLGKRLKDAGFKYTKENLELLERYALALHSLDRMREKKPVFGEWASEQQIRDYIADIQNNRKDIADAEKAWQEFRNDFLQTWMVDTGYWKQEFLDKLNATYEHYVPTFRVKSSGGVSQSFSKNGSKKYIMHEATGSSEDIYSPFASFVGMVDSMVTQVENNRVAQVFDRLYQQYKGMGEEFGRQILGSKQDSSFAPDPSKMNSRQQQLQDLLNGLVSDDIMSQAMKITQSQPGINQTDDANLLTVQREDGTTVQYEIHDPELFKLLAGVNKTFGGDMMAKALSTLGMLTRTMSMLTTGSNPLFAMRNAVRDYQNSVNYGSWASNYIRGIPRWLKSFYEVWRNDTKIGFLQKDSADVQAYEAMGGGGWTRVNANNQRSVQGLATEMFGEDLSTTGRKAKWALKKLWKGVTLDALNGYIEQASRFAEYKYGKHDTSTDAGRQEAFLAAQDVTVDFSRSGNSAMASAIKKAIPFFNASTQGVYRTGRQFTESERGMVAGENAAEDAATVAKSRAATRAVKTIINTALSSALASGLILRFMDDDDKEAFANMLSEGLKSNHLILPNPLANKENGEPPFLRIPLAQDPLTYAVHGAVTNAIWKGTEDETALSLAAIVDVILDNLNPLGSGTIFQPIVDVYHNRTWYGGAIIRSLMADWTDPSGQYNEDTPEVFRWLGNCFSISPEIIEYLATQYTGFLGSTLIPMLTYDETGNVGGFNALMNSITKKWTADPTTSNSITNAFYDAANDMSTIQGEAKHGRPQGLLLRSLNQEQVDAAYEEADAMLKKGGIIYDTKQVISEAYDKIDKINANPNLSDTEKAVQTREIRQDMLEQVVTVNQQIQAYYKKYVKGETLTDRLVGATLKRLMTGDMAHIKTPEEKLPQIFMDDTEEQYMKLSKGLYDATGNANILPHPTRSITIKDVDYEIPDADWDRYLSAYRDAYMNHVYKRYDESMTDEQKAKVFSGSGSAHSAGMTAIRDLYKSEHNLD